MISRRSRLKGIQQQRVPSLGMPVDKLSRFSPGLQSCFGYVEKLRHEIEVPQLEAQRI